jgi:hypothetical protein
MDMSEILKYYETICTAPHSRLALIGSGNNQPYKTSRSKWNTALSNLANF